MAPDKKVPSNSVNGGAIFTTILWIGITALYSYYINNFANYSVFYGSLANIVVLMLWIYFLSYFFVIGMAMNYREEIEETGVLDLKAILRAEEASAAAESGKKETVKEKIEKKFRKKKKVETEDTKEQKETEEEKEKKQ